jgi:CheY-like chemotaxis protein
MWFMPHSLLREYGAAVDIEAKTKIVAVTAHALEEERREILAAGCDDFIRKPYDYSEILDALTRNLGARFIYEGEAPPAAVAVQLSPEALAGLPDSVLKELEQAPVRIDRGAINGAIEEIRAHDASLADTLASEARGFRYGRILRLVRAAHTEIHQEEET